MPIIKSCKIHGLLTEIDVHPKGKSTTGKQYYGCKHCKKIASSKYISTNPEAVKIQRHNHHQNRKNNPEWREKKKKREREYQARRRKKEPELMKLKNKEYKRKSYVKLRDKILLMHKNMRDNLFFSYVKNVLNKSGFENPCNELIHAKANILLLKREIFLQNSERGKKTNVRQTRARKRGYPNDDARRNILDEATENFIKRKSV